MKKNLFVLLFIIPGFYGSAQIKVGQIAPEISLPDTSGNNVCLSSFKGKVVMIDFWASWCRPCRQLNPFNVELYKFYKNKGLEIFAVSIDDKRQSWINAIQKDQLKYIQVNDSTEWKSKITNRYNIHQIPATILIDKNGKIAYINPSYETLESKIKKLL